jgi:hypothetical protein
MQLSSSLPEDDGLSKIWDDIQAAADAGPLPPGEYLCRIVSGELCSARSTGTKGYKLTFQVLEGEFEGRRLWYDCWLTERALSYTKRDLAKIGIRSFEQLKQPIPPGIVCRCKVVLHRDDDGIERNRIKSFEFVRIDTLPKDPFAPLEDFHEGAGQ